MPIKTITTGIGDVINREDLTDLIVNVDPVDNVVFKMLPETTADGVLHQWVIDQYADADATAIPEGADYTEDTPPSMQRLQNATQIFRKVYKVSGTQQTVNKVKVKNLLAYYMTKAMTEIAKNVNKALIDNATVTTTDPRTLGGVKAFVPSGNTIDKGGSATFTEDEFNQACQFIYENGGKPRTAVVSPQVKRVKIDQFNASATKYLDASETEITRRIDVYETSFGTTIIKIDRAMPNNEVFILDNEYWRIAYLRRFRKEKLPKLGDWVGGVIIGELTLEALAPNTGARITNFTL